MRLAHRAIRFPTILAIVVGFASFVGGAWSLFILLRFACAGVVVDGWIKSVSLKEVRIDTDPICIWNVDYAFVDEQGVERQGRDSASHRGEFTSDYVAVEYLRDAPQTSRLRRNRGLAWLGCAFLFGLALAIWLALRGAEPRRAVSSAAPPRSRA